MYRSISAWTAGDGGGGSVPIFFFALFATLKYLLNRVDDIVHVLPTDRTLLGNYKPPLIQTEHHMRAAPLTVLEADRGQQSTHISEIAVLSSIPNPIVKTLKPLSLDHDIGFS